MEGKVVAITGTTSGTGFIAARTVAQKGATVILLNRKSSRAEAALEKLKAAVPGATFDWIECDLQNFESVRNASKAILSKYSAGVDVLCNNAGVMALEDKATADGYDVQMQTNHLSHFLLTKEIYPLLQKAAEEKGEARVVNHSSGARSHPQDPLRAESFGKNGGNLGGNGSNMIMGVGGRWKRYQQTKLANTCFSLAFTNRANASGSKVIMLSAHPGLSATNLQVTTNADGGMNVSLFTRLFMSFSQSPEDGTMGLLHCMCAAGVKGGELYGPTGITGKAVPNKVGKHTNDKGADLLWNLSEEACGKFEV